MTHTTMTTCMPTSMAVMASEVVAAALVAAQPSATAPGDVETAAVEPLEPGTIVEGESALKIVDVLTEVVVAMIVEMIAPIAVFQVPL
uniref:Putative secreted protein n=1 Tax=Anopheles marajoara TaxID=58244 RepID=A0A2M4CAK8_9DIPT